MLRHIHCFLTERGIGNEQHLIGLDGMLQLLDLFDQVFIDLQAAGGIENDEIGVG